MITGLERVSYGAHDAKSNDELIYTRTDTACSCTSSFPVDISLDRGRAWLFRNDAGDVFVDETIGKEESSPSASKEEVKQQKHGVEEEEKSPSVDVDMSESEPGTTPEPPSWITVSSKLQRAQQQLLYKHLYNALMSEAREWRIATRREQQLKGANSSNSATSTPAAATSAPPSATTPTNFTLPPSSHSSRPWSIVEITPRQISISIAGSTSGISINWHRGIGAGFEVTEEREGLSGVVMDDTQSQQDDSAIPNILSRLLCNQSLSILLDQTLKNSLGSRPLLEVLQSQSGTQSEVAGPQGGSGMSSTLGVQEEPWPAKPPSIIQFIVMSITHWRLVREVRQAIHQLQQKTIHRAETVADLPMFHVKRAKTTQPYLYAFTILVGKRFVLEATIRGVQFHVVTCLPPAQPSSVTYAIFGQIAPTPTVAQQYVLADMITITSAQHFLDILHAALVGIETNPGPADRLLKRPQATPIV